MVMQLLVGSKIIEVDNSVLEDRALLKVCSSSGCTYYSIKELITTSHKMAKGDRVRHRFSINQLKELCDKLEEDQKDFLRAHGFGNFLNISVFTVPIPPLDFIMRNFKLSVNELQLGNKSIRFTRAMVKQNLGFLCGDVRVDIKNVPPELVEQAKLCAVDYKDSGSKRGSKPLIENAIRLCRAEHNEEAFM